MIKIHDLVGLSKPLTRLIEVVSQGVGAVDEGEPGGVSPDTQGHPPSIKGRPVCSQRCEDYGKGCFHSSEGKVGPRQSNSIIAVAGKQTSTRFRFSFKNDTDYVT
jgi:hypothetical protein